MRYLKNFMLAICIVAVSGCAEEKPLNDAYGNFEAEEVLVSSEASGKIMELSINEGDVLTENQVVGYIDTIQLHLKKIQLKENIKAIKAKLPNISTQIDVLKEKLDNAKFEQSRFERLVESNAVSTKNLDDVEAEIAVIEKQIIATRTSLTTQQQGLLAEIAPIDASIDILDDLIQRSIIKSIVEGTVLSKFSYKGELTAQGRPLFKIADISELICRAYVTEPQLSEIKLGQKVTVLVDASDGGFKEYSGEIIWVSSKSEFTPKLIQTRDERASLVYAVKILVGNDGYLKIGMPAEIKF